MKRKIRNKVKLHPVMSVLIIIFGVIILSLLLSIFLFLIHQLIPQEENIFQQQNL